MRELKFHEKKLLKKVNFFNWKPENDRENKVMHRYHIQRREDYQNYNKICGYVTRLVSHLSKLPSSDPFRIEMTQHLLNKLYMSGLTTSKKSLVVCEKLSVSSFCRRRLSVMLVKLRMTQTLKDAVTFIEQGHIKVGPETVTDASFHVNREYEDFITWSDSSKIRQKVLRYNDKLDDYELLGN
jgi:U3 small nucleolar ribonucleoprotein protein IMP3